MGKLCKCNGRLLCMCLLPFMMTGHLLVYILVTIFVTISYAPPKIPVHFVAPGSSSHSYRMASRPLNPFWNLRLVDKAMWNRLQHSCDRLYNPILRGNASGMPPQSKRQDGSSMMGCVSDCFSDTLSEPTDETKSMSDQMRAFVASMRCRDYPFIINQPNLCYNNETLETPLLLMAIKSQLGNFENRQAIRETWGRSGHVSGEYNVRGGDDDVFVRTDALVDYLNKQWEEHNLWQAYTNETDKGMDLFMGEVINNARPNRDPSTKYFIPESFYIGGYPAYAGGGGVVYSGSLALRLRKISEQVSLFPIDDVFLGMCLNKLGVIPSHHPGFLTFDLPNTQRGNPCAYKSVLLVHRRNPREMVALWNHLRNLRVRCLG
ncbi:hypothetical protein WMY93_021740 [Mugilogobius chulae]|uniref:Hexosyltransferase n=1 Tax=Mugilogobius chulae TaxID=88201 RepID=A0AAW0ND23_9GOBI